MSRYEGRHGSGQCTSVQCNQVQSKLDFVTCNDVSLATFCLLAKLKKSLDLVRAESFQHLLYLISVPLLLRMKQVNAAPTGLVSTEKPLC